jgi:hypothetical protein
MPINPASVINLSKPIVPIAVVVFPRSQRKSGGVFESTTVAADH